MKNYSLNGIVHQLGNLSYTPKGTAMFTFILHVQEEWKAKDGRSGVIDSYLPVECFGFIAEKAANEVKVGQSLTAHFNLRSNEWRGKYYVKISAWRIDTQPSQSEAEPDKDAGFPF